MPKGRSAKNKTEMTLNNTVTLSYYTIQDVMTILGCGRTKASEAVRALNDELEKQGYMRFPRGRVPKKFFEERYNLKELLKA
ncbi:ICEBs1 excisionase [Lacrimispora sp.]|uniref:ICEBs1 excisionase n=1 Tax=Lacrimispora sp. TaxID=2719234 RepID=UPI0028AD82CB|nr:ICEBs1 excisionase [Lacrimispora sp.]